jgi:N-acetylmuramoyl-L-alanine amidase
MKNKLTIRIAGILLFAAFFCAWPLETGAKNLTITSVQNVSEGISLEWEQVSGANGYYLYRKTTGANDWTRIKTLAGSKQIRYTDKTVKSGTTYQYKISSYAKKKANILSKTSGFIQYLKMPEISAVSNKAAGTTVFWKEVTGAQGYYIYRKTGTETKWSKVKTIQDGTLLSWVDEDANINGTKYSYTVKAYSGTYASDYGKTGVTIYCLSRPEISEFIQLSDDMLSLMWKKNAKATGYQIEYAENSSFTDARTFTVQSNKTVSKIIDGIQQNKTYYIRLRSYKKASKLIYYSSWSPKKKVTAASSLEVETDQTETKKLRIELDAGHGGSEDGAVLTYRTATGKLVTAREKTVNLQIALYLKEELEKYKGVSVYMTRSSDKTISSLATRVDKAVKDKADVIVSLHNNAVGDVQSYDHGSTVIVSNGNYRANLAKEEKKLATSILGQLSEVGLEEHGLLVRNSSSSKYPNGKAADYYGIIKRGVLANIPAIIVEHAFIDQSDEYELFLSSSGKLRTIAQADARGIAEYYQLEQKK